MAKPQVLVVQSEPELGQRVQRILEELGLPAPVTTQSVDDALRRAEQGSFDLVLVDHRLRGPQSEESYRRLHERLGAAVLDLPLVDLSDRGSGGAARPELAALVEHPLRHLIELALQNADTERRLRERERNLQAQLRQMHRLETLSILAGGIAHGFNNLLVPIMGYASMMMTQLEEKSPLRGSLEQIENAATRAAELARRLLDYSGRRECPLAPTRLQQIVIDMQDALHEHIPPNIQLRVELNPDAPPIDGNADHLRQVIANLVDNAREAIGDRPGTITLRNGVADMSEDDLAWTDFNRNLPPGLYAWLDITDDGEGMDDQVRSRLFEPYFTTRSAGRGLGLTAAGDIVRDFHGTIKVTTRPGGGSTFRILLPVSRQTLEQDVNPTDKTPPEAGPQAILVVDDEPAVRQLARRILERDGYHVLEAGDGREGLEVFERNAGRVLAVLLDLTMPNMSGNEVLDEIRRRSGDVPVILTSGYTEEAATHMANPKITRFLQKPFRPATLSEMLREMILSQDTTGAPVE